jgi:hypothetical protein
VLLLICYNILKIDQFIFHFNCAVKNYKNGQRGTVCIKKNIQKLNNFLTRGKNMKYMWGPRGDQDGNPRQGLCNSLGGLPYHSTSAE